MKRWHRGALLLGMPMIVLAFVLLNTVGSTQSSEQVENSDDGIGKAYEEVFFAVNPADLGDIYIQWDTPKSITNGEHSSTHWFLGAYKSIDGLFVDLDRAVLTNNLVYAVHYFDSGNSSLYLDLLDTNGVVVVENLYGNLMTGSNTDTALSLDVPLASFPNVAVIQLRCGAGEAPALSGAEVPALSGAEVYESRIYVNHAEGVMGASALDSGTENSNGVKNTALTTTGMAEASTPRSTSDCHSHENGNPDSEKSFLDSRVRGNDREEGIIYVDQSIGDDRFTGRSHIVSGQVGPKRTIRNGLTVADEADTLIIKSGAYNENLDIKDTNVKVVIEGNVRL